MGLKMKIYDFAYFPLYFPSNPMCTRRVVYLVSNDDLFILEVSIEVTDTYTQGTGG